MDEILLSEIIKRTNDTIRSWDHRPSTVYQYQMAWKALTDYFVGHNQVLFSKQLAEQYIRESKAKLQDGIIKKWRYKLDRLAVLMLIECFESGHISWKYHTDRPKYFKQSAYVLIHTDYLKCLKEEGKGDGTIQIYEAVSRQFLEYLEQRRVRDIA